MASFTKEVEIEFDVTCDICGKSLDYTENDNSRYGQTSYELKVTPCDHCMAEKDDELNAALETIKENSDYFDEEMKVLQDKIDALEVELTYNVLKNNETVTICH